MNNNPSEEELNEDENELNDENDFEGEIVEEHLSSGERGRRRKKVKIRKRVKIKRKATPKKRVKKTFETLIWIIVVIAFITTLVILILQLDLNTKNKKVRSVGINTATEKVLQHSNSFTNDKHFLL
jgi:cell division septal protein FtsQ